MNEAAFIKAWTEAHAEQLKANEGKCLAGVVRYGSFGFCDLPEGHAGACDAWPPADPHPGHPPTPNPAAQCSDGSAAVPFQPSAPTTVGSVRRRLRRLRKAAVVGGETRT